MRAVLASCMLLLLFGNTLTLIGLTTNVSGWMLCLALIGGPVLTGVAVVGILLVFNYSKRSPDVKRNQKRNDD